MSDDIFPIQSLRRERAQRAQTVQHLLIATLLITNAWPHLRHAEGKRLALSIVELAGGAAMIAGAAVERIHAARGHHSKIGWIEIGAAGMTLAEAIHRLYEPHTVAFRIVSFILPAILAALGVHDLRPPWFRALRATDDQLILRSGIRRHAIPLTDAQSFSTGSEYVEVGYGDGTKKRLNLHDVKNREAALAWAAGKLAARGLTAE